jgi:hypothetical protein
MTTENKTRFTVISNETTVKETINTTANFHSNPMYEKLLNFQNLQEQQNKKFSVDDLFKLC